MNHIAKKPSSSKVATENYYRVPTNLLQPMWLRSRESLVDDGLVYDPIAAMACRQCQLSSECLAGDVDQKQLLHATLTKLCDTRVSAFLESHPNAWVLNVGAGLDTRFYRLDNGLCHWIELDTNENLVWRQRLFHKNERYQLFCGSVKNTKWLDSLPIPDNAPVLIVCDQALLNCTTKEIATFVQAISRYFVSAQACFVIAGDRSSSKLGSKLGCVEYRHGFQDPSRHFLNWLPWIQWIKSYTPLDENCGRWKFWQKMVAKLPRLKNRYTPSLIELRW